MKSIIVLGKRKAPGSPRATWPDSELAGTTGSNQKYQKRYGLIDDWTEWHDLHPINKTSFYPGIKALRPRTYDWFRKLPGPDDFGYRPLYMFEMNGRTGGLDPSIRAAVRFPIEEVLDHFPPDRYVYSCQLDWMLPFYLLRGYQRVVLAGHGVSRELEHMARHRGILAWIAVLRERGVEVVVQPPSWFIPPKPYGIESGGVNWQ